MDKTTFGFTRNIPARIETVELNWYKTDWMEMTPEYRKIREDVAKDHGTKATMTSCFCCGYKFGGGDMMALIGRRRGTNKMLCQECVGKIKEIKR